MRLLKKSEIPVDFDPNIYKREDQLEVYGSKFWDGGILLVDSLQEKAEFYEIAAELSGVVKELITSLNERVYIGACFCDGESLYAHWRDMKEYPLFRNVSCEIKKNKCYELSLPEDSDFVDMLIESNFQYLTHVVFYLVGRKIVINPTFHTGIVIHGTQLDEVEEELKRIVKPYSDIGVWRTGDPPVPCKKDEK